MLIDAKKIKELRIARNLTQAELAKKAGISQSLIARIEKGDVDPAYSKMQKLLSVLMNNTNSLRAKDIMTKKVRSVNPNTLIKVAAKIMKKHNISQMPVVVKNNVFGTISEQSIAHALIEHPNAKFVKEIMEEPLPIVSPETSVEAISALLKHVSAVLVMKTGRLVGIITRADLLGLA